MEGGHQHHAHRGQGRTVSFSISCSAPECYHRPSPEQLEEMKQGENELEKGEYKGVLVTATSTILDDTDTEEAKSSAVEAKTSTVKAETSVVEADKSTVEAETSAVEADTTSKSEP